MEQFVILVRNMPGGSPDVTCSWRVESGYAGLVYPPCGEPIGRNGAWVFGGDEKVRGGFCWTHAPEPTHPDELQRIIACWCSWCPAGFGEPCVRPDGSSRGYDMPHYSRVRVAGTIDWEAL